MHGTQGGITALGDFSRDRGTALVDGEYGAGHRRHPAVCLKTPKRGKSKRQISASATNQCKSQDTGGLPVKFGELILANGGVIKVYSNALKHATIEVRLLLMNGKVLSKGSFEITAEKFIDIPKKQMHDWLEKCGINKADPTGIDGEKRVVYSFQSSHHTFDLYFSEQRSTSNIHIGSRELSIERPAEVASNERLAELIATEFYEDKLDLSSRNGSPSRVSWDTLPEVVAAREFRANGVPDNVVRLFLTFVSAMDRARDSTRLWCAAVALFESHPEVFSPHQAMGLPRSTLNHLLEQSGVSQRHGDDTGAWRCIAKSLAAESGSHMHQVIYQGIGDAEELLREVRVDLSLPMLRGEKIGPMWIRILADPGGANITRLDKVPVAVDAHVKRITENLGVTSTRDILAEEARPEIQAAWREAVAGADFGGPSRIAGTCAALDPALWSFGKYGCSYCEQAHMRVPIGRTCDSCQRDFQDK